MKSRLIMVAAIAAPLFANGSAFADPEAEVLHWWTSGGEAKSVAVLQDNLHRVAVLGQICLSPVEVVTLQ